MGKHYRKSSHSVFSIEVHIVWITKYRYKFLKGDVAIRTRDMIRRICTEENAEILSGVVSDDHVHILVSIDTSTSISKLVQYLKGKSSRKLQQDFPHLKTRYWGQHLWARGYFAVSTGNVSSKMIEKYIAHHFEEEDQGGDLFRVE
ncbi:MAG: IS200/IS605 family transposase [Mariprofundus sp.]|nr:IS200/IS605 family transposase [Mariprofundus sp.]